MQGYIVRVDVGGQQVTDDFDLDEVALFDVVTLTGRTYQVQRSSSERWRPWTWDVAASLSSGTDQAQGPVGTVKRRGYRWSGFVYDFRVPGHPLEGGSQSTLWNAVQSLTR